MALIGGFYDRFSSVAARRGERVAVEVQSRDGLDSWSYARLSDRAETLASALWSTGVREGDRVALLAENGGEWCAAYLGMLRLGAIPVPLDTSYTPTQVAKLIADSGAQTIVVSSRFLDVARSAADERPCTPFVLDAANGPSGSRAAVPPEPTVGLEDPAVILYTSGTTSDPKGVVLTHGNLLGEIDSALEVVTIRESDAVLGVLPLFHALAQLANFLLPLTVGARVVFLDTLSSADLLRAFDERGITVFCCVPQFFYLIHQRVLEQVARAGRLRRLAFKILLRTSLLAA